MKLSLSKKIGLKMFKTKLTMQEKAEKTALKLATATGVASLVSQSFAAGDTDFSKMNDVNIKIDNFGNIMGLMATAGMAIGGVLTAWGCVQLALAFRNDDADGKMRAGLTLISGILLLSIKAIINAITGH